MASSLAGPSSHLPLTAGRGRGGRSSAGRKREVVLRLLRGEDLDELLDQWSDGDPLLSELWDMAALTRPGVALSKPPVASPVSVAKEVVDALAMRVLGVRINLFRIRQVPVDAQ